LPQFQLLLSSLRALTLTSAPSRRRSRSVRVAPRLARRPRPWAAEPRRRRRRALRRRRSGPRPAVSRPAPRTSSTRNCSASSSG